MAKSRKRNRYAFWYPVAAMIVALVGALVFYLAK